MAFNDSLYPLPIDYSTTDIIGIFQWSNAVTNGLAVPSLILAVVTFIFISTKLTGMDTSTSLKTSAFLMFILTVAFGMMGILPAQILVLFLFISGASFFL